MNIDFNRLKDLPYSEIQNLKQMLTPKLNKYMPHTPTPKQAVFMNLTCPESFYGGKKMLCYLNPLIAGNSLEL